MFPSSPLKWPKHNLLTKSIVFFSILKLEVLLFLGWFGLSKLLSDSHVSSVGFCLIVCHEKGLPCIWSCWLIMFWLEAETLSWSKIPWKLLQLCVFSNRQWIDKHAFNNKFSTRTYLYPLNCLTYINQVKMSPIPPLLLFLRLSIFPSEKNKKKQQNKMCMQQFMFTSVTNARSNLHCVLFLKEIREKRKEMQQGITTHRGQGRDALTPGIMSFMLQYHSRSQRMKSSLDQRPGTWRGLDRAVDPRYPCCIDYHTLPYLFLKV